MKVQVGTGRFQVMACGVGIGNNVSVERGRGTASHIVYVMLVTMVMSMLLGRPKLSGALVVFLEASNSKDRRRYKWGGVELCESNVG